MQSIALCPKCRAEIALADVNVATDVALCRRCGQVWKYSELVEDSGVSAVDLNNPPPGTWYHDVPPHGFEVGASLRSKVALFLVPFMCAWSGLSLGGIYGSQLIHGHFDLQKSLFGIPFLLGTVVIGSFALMTICGKIVVRVEEENGVLFIGIGPMGWRRRFNWRAITSVQRTTRYGKNGPYSVITLNGEKKLEVGLGMKSERLDFMLAVLRKKCRESGR